MRQRSVLAAQSAVGLEQIVATDFAELVEQSVAFLQSSQTDIALALDPYWPKWDGPWWHALLLFELGLAERIPAKFLQTYAELVDEHYLHFFPFRLEQIPAHLDPVANVACHCFLGTYVQVTSACAVDVQKISPWIREWFLRYQTDDGGLNCDEAAYSKARPTGSVTSTVAALEATLADCREGSDLTGRFDFVDRGMRYLLERRLFRSLSTGEIINQTWLKPAFPRFYEYDIMRGLRLVIQYSLAMSRPVEAIQIVEAFELVDACLQENGFIQGASHCLDAKTRVPQGPGQALLTGQLARHPALLRFCDQPGKPNLWLTLSYHRMLGGLLQMLERGLIIFPQSAKASSN